MATSTSVGIQSLPVELLIKVFNSYLATYCPYEGYSHGRATLALVCKGWKCIAYEAVSLWVTIHYNQSRGCNTFALTQSQQHPLDIIFLMHLMEPEARGEAMQSFEEALEQVDRWQSALLTFTDDADSAHLLAKPAPLLETIVLLMMCKRVRPDHFIDLFQGNAPKLRCAYLTRVSIPWSSGILADLQTLHLVQLTQEGAPTLPETLDFLARSPHLQHLTLAWVQFLPLPDPEARNVYLPDLIELKLEDIHHSASGYLLCHIQAPHCERFFLKTPDDGQQWDPFVVVPYVKHFVPDPSSGSLQLLIKEDLVKCQLGESTPSKTFEVVIRGAQEPGTIVTTLLRAFRPTFVRATARVASQNAVPDEVEAVLQALRALRVELRVEIHGGDGASTQTEEGAETEDVAWAIDVVASVYGGWVSLVDDET